MDKQKLLQSGLPVIFSATELSNADYHGNRSHVSSSGLKSALYDPSEFHRKYVAGEPSKPSDAMQLGTYIHGLVLEPEKVSEEFVVFPGPRKAGNIFKDFAAQHPDRIIMSQPQHDLAAAMRTGFLALPAAKALLKDGEPEGSYFTRLDGMLVKVRLDWLAAGGQIMDVKTTSSELLETDIQKVIRRFAYHLSAALYVDVLKSFTGEEHPFYFAFLSKAGSCQSFIWKASDEMITAGRKAYRQAIQQLRICRETGIWELDPILTIPEISIGERSVNPSAD